ncbi:MULTISPECIES: ATP-binding cassette domain-containing protein [unclassified Enterococcus]|uniref:ATP-binding cassette domain-containing protein n=1 Tax=unclassified Enterococcus TaxID=2608891 RepID=UPI001904A8AB|nr:MULTISPECIES: ATP-binding cassette domain-containing protein [unclassified Enterococcus]MBK0039169.1 ATP-binding cassette domain-containing protein [Enterococcus sp. S52]MBK0071734.1 ATP-binding cassette domain-containing protein [Enterococcus sp. S53]MBK0142318.1 ATP-binding cassette domain-containing protein [Enterococcus sp. S76]MBK0145733.1 ATP-binding cassette domain-containing protein [Enterococcus sp. S77]
MNYVQKKIVTSTRFLQTNISSFSYEFKNSFKSISFSLKSIEKKKFAFMLATTLSLGDIIVSFLMPVFYKNIPDIVQGKINVSEDSLLFFLLLFLSVGLVIGISKFIQQQLLLFGYSNLSYKMLKKVLLTDLNVLFDSYDIPTIITRLVKDTNKSVSLLGSYSFISLVKFLAIFIIGNIIFIKFSYVFLLVNILLFIILLINSCILNPLIRKLEKENKSQIDDSINFVSNSVSSLPSVRINESQSLLSGIFFVQIKKIIKNRIISSIFTGLYHSVGESLVFIAKIVVLLITQNLFKKESVSFDDVIFLITLNELVSQSYKDLATFIQYIQNSIVSIKRVEEILQISRKKSEENSIEESHNVAIQIKNLCFSYSSSNNIFCNYNLSIFKGEHVAIIGKSGEGKSTLAKLLLSQLRPISGEIIINGDILNVDQKNSPFYMSLKENIVLNEPFDSFKFSDVLELSSLDNTIMQNQINIEENIAYMSGGEAQKLEFSRLFYHNVDILILDEATSALDKNSAKFIIKNLVSNFREKTIVFITHDLELLSLFDRVIEITSYKGE